MASPRGVAVPSFVPPLTPISYAVTKVVNGYTSRKLIGTRLVRRKNKSRRVRVNVYKTVEVPARRVLVWVVQYPEVRVLWYNVADYQRAIEDQKNIEGHEVGDIEMEIFHSSPADDVIHAVEEIRNGRVIYFGEPTLFVWRTTRLPRGIKVYNRARPFRMVRIWFWVFHTEKREYRLWCRSSVVFESNFDESQDFAHKLYEQVEQDIEEQYTYLEVRGLVAWTAYTLGERARRRDKRAEMKKIGGAE